MENINFKELYDVTLKTTFPMEANDRQLEAGETVAAFDKIQLANFEEAKSSAYSKGGYDNRPWIWWEETREVKFSLIQGVFSKSQLSVMSGAGLITHEHGESIIINKREIAEVQEDGSAQLKYPIVGPVFVYDKLTGKKITEFSYRDNVIITGTPYQELLIDYNYEYSNGYQNLVVGQSLTSGYLTLLGKMKVKDDMSGQVTTGIIKIPKLKLMSTLSMRLGQNSVPVVGRVDAIAVPDGGRGRKKVMELLFLNDDLDSDM